MFLFSLISIKQFFLNFCYILQYMIPSKFKIKAKNIQMRVSAIFACKLDKPLTILASVLLSVTFTALLACFLARKS